MKAFINEISKTLNDQDMEIDKASTLRAGRNTLAVTRKILGVLSPRNLSQLKDIIAAANKFAAPLYIVSQGKNIGYGEMTPVQSGQFVVSLRHLNAIRSYDAASGEVVVEPGVTQAQLAQFLLDNNAPYWADVTGASPSASILGNTLEGGFGHTPLGDHRKHILDMEIILADGTQLNTGEMPGLGPDLAPLFVQSNFAVVTAIKIPLFPIPAACVTYVLSFKSEGDFMNALPVFTRLKGMGVITSLIHSGNATRTFITSGHSGHSSESGRAITDEQCLEILNRDNLLPAGAWTTVGAVYGLPQEVKEKIQLLKKSFKGIGEVKVFTDKKMKLIDKLIHAKIFDGIKSLAQVRKSFGVLKTVHGLLRGQPSEQPTLNMLAQAKSSDQLGVAWFAPVVPANSTDLNQLLMAAKGVYKKYNFAMPVTLTLINNKKFTAVFNFNFDKSSPLEVERVHAAYAELSRVCQELGYLPYRAGLLSPMDKAIPEAKSQLLNVLKNALDPNNILNAGRYNIQGIARKSYPLIQTETVSYLRAKCG